MTIPPGPCSLPIRVPDTHKGDYGRVLVVAGSLGMSGAAVLAAQASLRTGCGLTWAGVPERIHILVAPAVPCVMAVPLPQTGKFTLAAGAAARLHPYMKTADAVALGPGLGRHPSTGRLVEVLVQECRVPLVVDADGLNLLSERLSCLRQRPAPTILTPHPGEWSRLLGHPLPPSPALREKLAREFSRAWGVILVVKGHRTLVTDGKRVYRNTTGNPGMATAGSGDVLTGVIAGLLAQGLDPGGAAVTGVYLHGLAGDLAARKKGEAGMIATDLLDFLPAALRTLAKKRRR